MKKLLAAALACTVVFAAGCTDSTPAKTTTTGTTKPTTTLPSSSSTNLSTQPTGSSTTRPSTTYTTIATKPTTPPKYAQYYSMTKNINYWEVEIDTKWSDDTLLFKLLYPELILDTDHTYAESAIVQRLNRIIYDFLDRAEDDRLYAMKFGGTYIPYEAEFKFLSFDYIIKNKTFVVTCQEFFNLWGPHPNYGYYHITFDRTTGEQLMLDDIIDITKANELYQMVCDGLPTDVSYNGDPVQIIKEEFFTDLGKTENWHFTEDGLCFFFNTYVLASHAYGTIEVVIPYSELGDILLPRFMP